MSLKTQKNKLCRAIEKVKKQGWTIITNSWIQKENKRCCALTAFYLAYHPEARDKDNIQTDDIRDFVNEKLGIDTGGFIDGFDGRTCYYSDASRIASHELGKLIRSLYTNKEV